MLRGDFEREELSSEASNTGAPNRPGKATSKYLTMNTESHSNEIPRETSGHYGDDSRSVWRLLAAAFSRPVPLRSSFRPPWLPRSLISPARMGSARLHEDNIWAEDLSQSAVCAKPSLADRRSRTSKSRQIVRPMVCVAEWSLFEHQTSFSNSINTATAVRFLRCRHMLTKGEKQQLNHSFATHWRFSHGFLRDR